MDKELETSSEALEPKTSETAEHAASQQTKTADSSLADLETRLGERIQAEVERRFQSAKDKRWSQLEKQYGALSELAQAPAPTPTLDKRPGKQSNGELASARRLIGQAGLMHDPEALDLLRAYRSGAPGAGTRLLEGISQLALRRLSREPVKAGAVIQPSGGLAVQDVRADYERRVRKVRPGDVAGLAELKREFRKKGLEVF